MHPPVVIHALDHVVVTVRDLDVATERTSALLGRPPSWRGAHPGMGTANTLFRLDNTYLELLAPVGPGALADGVRAGLDARGEGLSALCFATDDASDLARSLRARGLAASEPTPGEGRDADSGACREWLTTTLPPAATRGLFLFAIEHRSPEDALPRREPDVPTAAAVHALDHVVVMSPNLEASRNLYGDGLGLRLALDRSFEKRGVRLLFFRVGGATVEVGGRLDAPADADAPDRFGGLAWRVPDAEAARERLERAGFDLSPVRDGAKPGTRVFSVRADTCGVPTLVIEPSG